MTWQDLCNGIFEGGGSIMAWLNVAVLYRAKEVRGVSVSAFAFFAAWGVWNLYYYPHLNQWASFVGGVPLACANVAWVVLAVIYRRRKSEGT